MTTTTRLSRPRHCPRCGTTMVRILYGMPAPEAFEAAEQGRIILGGCMVGPDSPRIGCPSCNYGVDPEGTDPDELHP